MLRTLRARFWLETVLAAVSGLSLAATLIQRQWIELVFRVDPDQGSGVLEWTIVGVLLAATILSLSLARGEWRRAGHALA